MSYNIRFTKKPTIGEIEALQQGLDIHANITKQLPAVESFGFMVDGGDSQILAGCTGFLMYNVMVLDLLWVDENQRGKGVGSQLLSQAENHAKAKECHFVTVQTFNWQAKAFYERHRYNVRFVDDGYAEDGHYYFLKKSLV